MRRSSRSWLPACTKRADRALFEDSPAHRSCPAPSLKESSLRNGCGFPPGSCKYVFQRKILNFTALPCTGDALRNVTSAPYTCGSGLSYRPASVLTFDRRCDSGDLCISEYLSAISDTPDVSTSSKSSSDRLSVASSLLCRHLAAARVGPIAVVLLGQRTRRRRSSGQENTEHAHGGMQLAAASVPGLSHLLCSGRRCGGCALTATCM
jgi:hypothetical protein